MPRRFRKRPLKKGTRAIAKRAESIAKSLASTRERKHFVVSQATTTFSTSGVITCLTNMAQGDTVSERQGNQITARSIHLRFSYSSSASFDGYLFRVIAFQDKQQVGDTVPLVTDILGTTPVINSPYNFSQKGRFKILWDHTWANGTRAFSESLGVVDTPSANVGWFPRWLFPTAKNIGFNGPASTDQQKNHVYLLVLGSSTVQAYDWITDFCYTDS